MKNHAFQKRLKKHSGIQIKSFIVVCLITISSTTIVSLMFIRGSSRPNELALGANTSVKGEIDIKLMQTASFNGMRIRDILGLRKSVVIQNQYLLKRPYTPFWPIFKWAEDGLSWFSLKKYYYFGPAPGDNEGPSLRSKTILNPFLLVSAEIWGLSVWVPDGIQWNESLINENTLARFDFPYYCKPSSLRWNPEEKRAAVIYPLQYYISELNRYIVKKVDDSQLHFGIVAYNALDFGFRFISLNSSQSKNIDAPDARGKFIAITDHIRRRDANCPTLEPCNASTFPTSELRNIQIRSLPARLSLHLWKNPPETASQPPDFDYDILFE